MRAIALLLVISLLVSVSFGNIIVVGHTERLIAREPIIIIGNEGLTPENGVVGGSGTPDDPYVIEGWRIFATGAASNINDAAIILYDVSGYFLLRNLELYHQYDDWWHGTGIYVYAPNAHIIIEDTVFRELNFGIHVVAASLVVRNSTFLHILSGIRLGGPALNEANISGNVFIDVGYGVRITEANQGNIIVRDNIFYMPPDSLTIMEYGVKSADSSNLYIGRNTILCYSLTGVQIRSSDNVIIEDNNIGWNESCEPEKVFTTYGVFLYNSSNIIVKENTLENTMIYGIYAYNITNLTVQGNIIHNTTITYWEIYRDQGAVPIFVNISRNVVLESNNVSRSEEYGIRILGSSKVTVNSNMVAFVNKAGLDLYSTDTTLIKYNTIVKNGIGIQLNRTTNTTILYNSLIENDVQVTIEPGETAIWDDGFMGNYWSDYQGTDNDGDHIGDQPYVIDRLNRDNHPLLPFATITGIESHPGEAGTTILILNVHIEQPPGIWRITVTTPSGEEATATITVTKIPSDVISKLTLPAASNEYIITLTAPHGETAAIENTVDTPTGETQGEEYQDRSGEQNIRETPQSSQEASSLPVTSGESGEKGKEQSISIGATLSILTIILIIILVLFKEHKKIY